MYGCTDAIPFSCFHAYQRSDSIWVNQYTTPCDVFSEGFDSKTVRLLPAFISYDCVTDQYTELKPAELPPRLVDPIEFGDDWSEPLSADEIKEVNDYFLRIEGLRDRVDAIVLRVGAKDVTVDLPPHKRKSGRQIIFEVPRGSLMTAVRYQVFDDLLIGNFMKTTLIGNWPASRLHPHFTPVVAKYADNGLAYSMEDLDNYFHSYRSRNVVEFVMHRFHHNSEQIFRNFVSPQSKAFDFGKRAFFFLKKMV